LTLQPKQLLLFARNPGPFSISLGLFLSIFLFLLASYQYGGIFSPAADYAGA
jgi:hypothetical protein